MPGAAARNASLRSEAQDLRVKVENARTVWATISLAVAVCLGSIRCGGDEEQGPDPADIIDGTWTGNLISESTAEETSFEAILCYGEDPQVLPPYYYDIMRGNARITNANYKLVGVKGVFKIRSDNEVDTLAATGGFSVEWGLCLELSADRFYSRKYRLMNGTISDNMVEGLYEEFELGNGHHYQVDAGIWRGARTVEPESETQQSAQTRRILLLK